MQGISNFLSISLNEKYIEKAIKDLDIDFFFPLLQRKSDWSVDQGDTKRTQKSWKKVEGNVTHSLSWEYSVIVKDHESKAKQLINIYERIYDEDDEIVITILEDYSVISITEKDSCRVTVCYENGYKRYSAYSNLSDVDSKTIYSNILFYLPLLTDGFQEPQIT